MITRTKNGYILDESDRIMDVVLGDVTDANGKKWSVAKVKMVQNKITKNRI